MTATNKLRATITFPEVERGVKRTFRAERDSGSGDGHQMVHDFDVGSEQLDVTLSGLNEGEKVKVYLYPLKNGVMGNNPLTLEFTASNGQKQAASDSQLGYEVMPDDGNAAPPRMRSTNTGTGGMRGAVGNAGGTDGNTVANQPQGTGGFGSPLTQSPGSQSPPSQTRANQLNPNLTTNLNGPPSHPTQQAPAVGEVHVGNQTAPQNLGPSKLPDKR